MAAGENPHSTNPEPPLDKILEAAEQHPQVYVIIRRQHPSTGRLAACTPLTVDTKDLHDGAFEERLRTMWGGGHYRIDARNPQNTTDRVIPPYFTDIPGQPTVGSPGGPAVPNQQTPYAPAFLPPLPMQGMHVPGGASYRLPPTVTSLVDDPSVVPPMLDPKSFMGSTPDQIALFYNEQNRLRAEADRKEYRETLERLEIQLKAEREERRQIERARAENEARLERENMQSQINALRVELGKPQLPPKPTLDFAQLSAMLTALTPIVTALISSSTNRADSAMKAHQDAARAQMEGLKDVVKTQLERAGGSEKLFETALKVVPVIVPLAKAWLEERSPGKTAELVSAMAENNLTTLSMVAQFVNQFADNQPESIWASLAKQAIQGVQQVAERMSEQIPQTRTLNGSASAPRQFGSAKLAPGPTEIAQMIASSPQTPVEYRTDQWRELFKLMLDPAAEAEKVATAIAQHLDALRDENKLPLLFANFYDDGAPNPSEFLKPLLDQLPIAQTCGDAPARITAICVAFDDAFSGEDETAESNGVGATMLTTPPPSVERAIEATR